MRDVLTMCANANHMIVYPSEKMLKTAKVFTIFSSNHHVIGCQTDPLLIKSPVSAVVEIICQTEYRQRVWYHEKGGILESCTEICDSDRWDTFVKQQNSVGCICWIATYKYVSQPYFQLTVNTISSCSDV